MALSTGQASLSVSFSVKEINSGLGAGAVAAAITHALTHSETLPNGTGAGKQDVVYSERRTVNGTEIWDLRASLANVLDPSQTTSFPVVSGILIVNRETATGREIQIGGASNPWSSWVKASGDGVRLGPGGIFLLTGPVDGYATVAGTGDQLIINPTGSDVVIDLIIWGRSA